MEIIISELKYTYPNFYSSPDIILEKEKFIEDYSRIAGIDDNFIQEFEKRFLEETGKTLVWK